MSCILAIETSTEVCSVALGQDGDTIFEKVCEENNAHTRHLATFVDEALSFANSHAIPLDAVAITEGPGSYTGLRIGTSTAKGICYGFNIPLITIPTLKMLCARPLLYEELDEDALLCPMIDARRMEVYAAIYDRSLRNIRETQADIIDETSYADYLEKQPIYFFGNGAEKCIDIIKHPNARFIPNIKANAKSMLPLAELAIAKNDFADVAYFEPYYLKEFVATKAKQLF
ncbi:MAG: tRNA (adenosine(37)-N6)-threonylcarbamoyltransferase complex dimerization subunit type 1 TsaB [Bacteroidaceae bacterium]|nr:tRNA (adenosine(37)-N6)-threonylcarbamoyltransferase complex dimerization subunit type 1 TsaB [Bacteroidaceae bacterium]